ncbi:iron(III) transport system substrate-binding protein [Bacillus horti]|uniref:Iron(III) transport system substrate-binding protein n=2 Tax=Caldalkalibacillus horti TaxID=77523 RepID=A0ABT9VW88_9BACI|nr:iron(III) transport system substrate-binding protein [Bacillus horti]
MKNQRKLVFLALFVVAIFTMLAGCGTTSDGETTGTQQGDSQGTETESPSEASGEAEVEEAGEVNLYSARHYDIDAELYGMFEEQTGIKVNVVEGDAPELIERMKREGASTPADLFITVDGGILNTAKVADILQPIESDVIDAQVPADLRDVDSHWVGLSTRARVLVYAKDRVDPSELSTYEDLATEKWQGRVLARSSSNLYNLSLIASLVAINGEEETQEWANGIAANLARDPEGGDRDQAKAVVAGAGDVAIMNTYYIGRMTVSDDAEEVKVAESVGIFFPNQETTGTHINLSGVGLSKYSQNKENAIKLIEFLTDVEAQSIISQANFEYPVNTDAEWPEILESWGTFEHQKIDFAAYGENNPKAVEIANKAGWK